MAAADTITTSRVPYGAGSMSGISGHTKTPSTLKFLVSNDSGEDEAGEGLKDTGNFRRVQELFSVSMSVCSDGEGYDVVCLTGSDADRIEKARCYVMAMSCPQFYYNVQCSDKIAAHLVGRLRTGIEREHLVYLRNVSMDPLYGKLHPQTRSNDSTVRVQGMDEHVSGAVAKIHKIIEMVEDQGRSSIEVADTVLGNMEPAVSTSPYPKAVLLTYYPNGGKGSEGRWSGDSSNRHLVVDDLVKGERTLPLVPRDSPDQNLEKRTSYFVNTLDFPRERVQAVLESLGPQASDNEVMDLLMKGLPGVQPINKSMNSRRIATPLAADGGSRVLVDEHEQQVLQPKVPVDPSKLRPIVIDGSNVAMRHGNGQVFSCRGIQIAVDYFRERGHQKVTVFVPEWRKETSRPETPIADQHLLDKLEKEKHLVYTPSRRLNGKRIVCYDDRYIVKLAHEEGGVIVSNDQFRDLMQENPDWKKVIEQRLLQFAFVSDYFMPPDDPLGKSGPTLDQFLCKDHKDLSSTSKKSALSERLNDPSGKPICPHLGNCTFGKKCRYYHPDRPQPQAASTVLKREPSHLSNHSSRNVTPSPSHESWAHGGRLYSAAKRGYVSNHSSTDELYQERNYVGTVSGMDMTTPISSGIDVSRLADELDKTSIGASSKPSGGFGLNQSTKNRVVSSPVYSDSSNLSVREQSRPQNHTFPLVHLSHQRESLGGHNFTGDHSYLLNQSGSGSGSSSSLHLKQGTQHLSQGTQHLSQGSLHLSQGSLHLSQGSLHLSQGSLHSSSSSIGPPDHYGSHQYSHRLPPQDSQHETNCQLLPRDPRSQPQFPHRQGQALYPHQLAPPPSASPVAHNVSQLRSNPNHSSSEFYEAANPVGSSRPNQHYNSPAPLTNTPSLPGYNGHPSIHHANHHAATPPLQFASPCGGAGMNQSNVPLHSLPQFSMCHSHNLYNQCQSIAGGAYPASQGYRREVDTRNGRQELYRAAVAKLPGYEKLVQLEMDKHVELTSVKDLHLLIQYINDCAY